MGKQMRKTTTIKLERITITVPQTLIAQIEQKIEHGGYASLSEWIRFAIREQLERETTSADQFFAEDKIAREAWENSRTTEGTPYDKEKWRKRLGG